MRRRFSYRKSHVFCLERGLGHGVERMSHPWMLRSHRFYTDMDEVVFQAVKNDMLEEISFIEEGTGPKRKVTRASEHVETMVDWACGRSRGSRSADEGPHR
jgi:hypothetical protein